MSRPTKIPTEKLAALILKAMDNTQGLLLTDLELFHVMNYGRPYAERVCYRTFQRYKAAAMAYGQATVEEQEKFDPMYGLLYDVLMENTINQKIKLYDSMMTAEGNEWHRYKWTMERKFPDMNLRLQTQRCQAEYEMQEKAWLETDLEEMGLEDDVTPIETPQLIRFEEKSDQVEVSPVSDYNQSAVAKYQRCYDMLYQENQLLKGIKDFLTDVEFQSMRFHWYEKSHKWYETNSYMEPNRSNIFECKNELSNRFSIIFKLWNNEIRPTLAVVDDGEN